jgi:filamentous hemagglutinin
MRAVFTHDKNQFWANPNTTQKRLGDGAYEQKLIREQVALLTGKRFLGDYSSDEAQFMALMNNGVMSKCPQHFGH